MQSRSSLVGDGGASWRLKALKRAREQAARQGINFNDVMEDRWGSSDLLTATSDTPAPSRAHLQAIRSRRKGLTAEHPDAIKPNKGTLHAEMKIPEGNQSLTWSKKRDIIPPIINNFPNDGTFFDGFLKNTTTTTAAAAVHPQSSNRLAAKVLQLRMKGRHEEADKISKPAEVGRKRDVRDSDGDAYHTRAVMRSRRYDPDDEYEHGDAASSPPHRSRIETREQRCSFCLQNAAPVLPHLTVAVGNFTYMMLPPWRRIAPGHCLILPLQHEPTVRSSDAAVLGEFRNFKKCLIAMFRKEGRRVLFMETAVGLVRRRRHCVVECVPLPAEAADAAPMYFKKAIDEAEDEWSQHDAKKLIDTSAKGLRGSIPEGFPYFHVEFGLDRGFVHVVDDERSFKSSFGIDVVRGILQVPAEDFHRRRDGAEHQKAALASFLLQWEPFDWTKQLRT